MWKLGKICESPRALAQEDSESAVNFHGFPFEQNYNKIAITLGYISLFLLTTTKLIKNV